MTERPSPSAERDRSPDNNSLRLTWKMLDEARRGGAEQSPISIGKAMEVVESLIAVRAALDASRAREAMLREAAGDVLGAFPEIAGSMGGLHLADALAEPPQEKEPTT